MEVKKKNVLYTELGVLVWASQLAVWVGASYVLSLSLHFFNCKMKVLNFGITKPLSLS